MGDWKKYIPWFGRAASRVAGKEITNSAEAAKPRRLYAVIGIKREVRDSLPYSTDPRTYGLNVFKKQVSDREFEKEYVERVRVYQSSDAAIDDMYQCGLEPPGSFLLVFTWKNGSWVEDRAEAIRLMKDVG